MSQLRILDQIQEKVECYRNLSNDYEQIIIEAINKCRKLESKDVNGLTKEQSEFIYSCTNATFKVNKKGLVDVNGNFDCSKKNLKDFHGINFGTIKGNFRCSSNSFNSFKNFPTKINGTLDITDNKFITLEGIPEAQRYVISSNYLISLRFVDGNKLYPVKNNKGLVSELTISFIYKFMKEKKSTYEETIKLLEKDIKKGSKLTSSYIEKKYDLYLYSDSEKGKDEDWNNLDKGQDLTDTIKGCKLMERFGIS